MTDLVELLKSAPKELLEEIIRESEITLDAQLSAGTAADARAFTLLGYVATIAVVLVGASFTLQISNTQHVGLSILSFACAFGCIISSWFLYQSGKPTDWEYAGNSAKNWRTDLLNKIPLNNALAEQCAHYSEAIATNNRTLEASAKHFDSAVKALLATLVLGGLSSVFFWLDALIISN